MKAILTALALLCSAHAAEAGKQLENVGFMQNVMNAVQTGQMSWAKGYEACIRLGASQEDWVFVDKVCENGYRIEWSIQPDYAAEFAAMTEQSPYMRGYVKALENAGSILP